MKKNCKNCNHSTTGNFCSNCGQSTNTERLNFSYLVKIFRKIYLKNLDSGLRFTAKELFVRPGYSIREYLEGKRVKHFEPISFLFTVTTVYAFLYHYFNIDTGNDVEGISKWILNNFPLFSILIIPIYSFGSFISFREQNYNFVEHFIINIFLSGQRIVFRILTFPLLIYCNNMKEMSVLLFTLLVADITLLIVSYYQIFSEVSNFKLILISILTYFLVLVFIFLFIAMTIVFIQSY